MGGVTMAFVLATLVMVDASRPPPRLQPLLVKRGGGGETAVELEGRKDSSSDEAKRQLLPPRSKVAAHAGALLCAALGAHLGFEFTSGVLEGFVGYSPTVFFSELSKPAPELYPQPTFAISCSLLLLMTATGFGASWYYALQMFQRFVPEATAWLTLFRAAEAIQSSATRLSGGALESGMQPGPLTADASVMPIAVDLAADAVHVEDSATALVEEEAKACVQETPSRSTVDETTERIYQIRDIKVAILEPEPWHAQQPGLSASPGRSTHVEMDLKAAVEQLILR